MDEPFPGYSRANLKNGLKLLGDRQKNIFKRMFSGDLMDVVNNIPKDKLDRATKWVEKELNRQGEQ